MKTTTNVFIKIGAVIVAIVMLFTIYIVIVKNKLPKSIEYKSFDKEKSITIDLDSNITSYDYSYDDFSIMVTFNNRNNFINMLKNSKYYYDTFEYSTENGRMVRVLWYSDKYFYSIRVYEDSAIIENLVACVWGTDCFPFVTDNVNLGVKAVGGVFSGGEILETVDKLNNSGKYVIKNKLFSNYNEMKSFLLMTNNNYYQFNDETKTIKIKMYSTEKFNNGTNFADGYPVTVQFDETETNVKISVDLSIYQKD